MRYFTLILFLFTLSACYPKIPALPTIDHREIKNIGIITNISKYPRHKHVGTTVFNNFDKEIRVDWKITERVAQNLHDCLVNTYNCNVINIPNSEFTSKELNSIIVVRDGRWVFNEKYSYVRERLLNEFKLDVLIGVNDGEYCIIGDNELTKAKGYGLFTRSFLGLDTVYAYYYIIPYILYLDKPGRVGGLKYLPEREDFKEILSQIDMSLDIQNLQQENLNEIRDRVLAFVGKMTAATCDAVFKIGQNNEN